MNTALWIGQVLLAAIFALSGVLKSTMSRQRMLETGQTGAAAYPLPVVRFTAICELFAVVGLILPVLLGIAPALTGWAAAGLAVVMLGAMAMHGRLAIVQHKPAEWRNVGVNALILAVCLFVAIGRL
ncbi:putative membrane protein YphA (DoxX/SURF4 family) [Amycolatopsis lexingtonensis]|uniref:Membrane protein YphA (DoxX/SURF4 family) n=1 Tax=Amycolatopsis lexingtonensis TaxID=218822 RepID=A0ABR9I1F9_9PSEU|nr:DoxX family protein [Amycolatopsis lexingtonensis]MBE1497023.1 putative membrane protein YphA (DoxX/SURF4 family) [Amycolatopsis lexingtonensis]